MQAIFKSHSVHQQTLFPLDLNVLIPENHSARLIDSVVEKLDIPDIISQYKGGGTSSYHPKMHIKILFYGYLNNTYSSPPLILQVNPIHSLNKIINRTEVKTKILQLKADVTTLAMEQGTEFFTETNSSSPLIQEDLTPNPQGIQFGPVFPNSILRIHSHDYPALEPVFSADDIYKMASFYKQKRQFQAPDAEDISSILVSNLGIFALRVTDPAKAKTFGDKLFNSAFLKLFNVNYDKRIRIEAYNNCNCILPNILYEKYLSNNLIDFLIKQDSGLTLYKAIVNVDGSLSWSILEKMN